MRRVALVTGASRGIGRAIMERLATDGLTVVGCASTSGPIQAVAEELRSAGLEVEGLVLDVADPASCADVVADVVERHGRLDVLVHAAAILEEAPFLNLDVATWQRTLEVNLSGTFYIGQAAARHMVGLNRDGGGKAHIVNISSTVAKQAELDSAHYSASKGGVEALSRAMALELAAHGVLVNCVAPGFVATAMTEEFRKTLAPHVLARLNPMGAFGQPEDIAHVVAMICDPRTDFVTGATFAADGGQTSTYLS